MKKGWFGTTVVLAVCITVGVAFAAAVNRDIIATTVLDADPTSVSGDRYIQNNQRTAFFVVYDETEVGETLKAIISIYVSDDDGDNWVNGSFYDFAGGTTLQTTQEISSDGNYYFWLNPEWTIDQVRVVAEGYNTDADDLISISVGMLGYK